ncbi:hypothetical protein FJZ31_28200 [Candidatus Poribacteria bacterium]|nr:hypothetical protein [Candidatus Poribacteria bacterium]
MGKKKLPYKEGDWFGVPLEDGGYAVGLIARSRRGGKALFGYFFGPRRSRLPNLNDIRDLTMADAILIGRFGDLGLYTGEWPIIGHSEPWDRNAWPMLPLIRVDEFSKKAWKVEYSEDDPSLIVQETPCDAKEAYRFPRDRAMGSGAVELRLMKLFSSSSQKEEGGPVGSPPIPQSRSRAHAGRKARIGDAGRRMRESGSGLET